MASPARAVADQAAEAESFRWGLERILDGVQALITAGGAA
jgi:hypothetical protein